MSSSPLRRHSLAIGTDGTPARRPPMMGPPSSPIHGVRSVSSSSALPVLSQGRSFSPSLNNVARPGVNSAGSPYPTRLITVPSRDQLSDTGTPSRDRNRDVASEDGHVQVVLRIRPSYTSPESDIPQRFQRVVLQPSPGDSTHEVAVHQPEAPRTANKAKSNTFRYDRILPEECTQVEAYNASAKSAMDKFLKGFNVTILAYGQTSSGKSYTMGTTGSDTDYTIDSSRTGIIPRAVKDMFGQLEQEQRQAGGNMSFECKVSFLELYNEDLIDLLSITPHNQTPPITIREDKGKIIWSGLREVTVSSIQQVMQLLHDGSTRRQVGETGMNKESSRSHAVFSLSLVQRKRSESVARPKNFSRPMSMAGSPYSASPRGTPANTRPGSRTSMLPPPSSAIRQFSTPSTPDRGSPDDDLSPSGWVETTSKFHFADLAGSERLKRTAAFGERMKEGISINAGLTALGNVISTLAEPASKNVHIPYRDSKLTRLLQDSLGGNSYTIMIACVSPIEYNLNETINTLRYGARARNIKNRAEANQTEVGWDDLVHLQGLVVKLRKELENIKAGRASGSEPPRTPSLDEAADQARLQLAQEQQFADSLRTQVQTQNLEIARLMKQVQTYKQGGVNLPDTDGMTFSQMVEPIIDEYEKTIVNLEAEIERYKAALQISETVAEEHIEQIALKNKRLEAQETYIHELRTRITKYAQGERELEERIRGLESPAQMPNVTGDDSQIVQRLKGELNKQKQTLALNATYLAELESRLETSDDRVEDLTRQIADLEREAKQPGEQEDIASNHDPDVDANRRLKDTLEKKDSRLRDLQRELDKALKECTILAGERKDARTPSERHPATRPDHTDDAEMLTKVPGSPILTEQGISAVESDAADQNEDVYSSLKKDHIKTLADLTIMNEQYQKALADINRLTSQLEKTSQQEATAAAAGSLRQDLYPPRDSVPTKSGTAGEDIPRLTKVNGDLSLSSIAGNHKLERPSAGTFKTKPSDMDTTEDQHRPLTSQEMAVSTSDATLAEASSLTLDRRVSYTEHDNQMKLMQQQLVQALAEVQEKTGELETAKRNLENSDRNLRKLRMSVQEAYAARDAAVLKADSVEREVMGLRLDVASLRDQAIASSISMERMLSEERRASPRVQPQATELDAEQKMPKFRCF
ncbi:hypothetical protein QFC20_006331 [Naganishia adeliensis]|uniref:Uncharacterized protein n=1 Tax=Naganishia adeliensis TaxID=92952 RepID=A0ACC2VBV7_9TREE|nr:hypothetical protein QFC20_006331 [Naganishia adeliensis]